MDIHDPPSALIVMRGVRSIARTGQTVMCTIHQPSKQIFELFDSLFLLQKGGYMAFFGELGDSSEKLLDSAERAIFYRERMSNCYNPLPYSFSLFIAELLYLALTSMFFMNVECWIIGWQESVHSFFLFWFVYYLYISNCTSVGQFIVVLMPNAKVANVAVGVLLVFFNLFSGLLTRHIKMKGFYRWIRYLVITNYSLESLAAIEMRQCDATSTPTHSCTNVTIPTMGNASSCEMPLIDYIYRNMGILIGTLAFPKPPSTSHCGS